MASYSASINPEPGEARPARHSAASGFQQARPPMFEAVVNSFPAIEDEKVRVLSPRLPHAVGENKGMSTVSR
jgi:hypothetical protein